MEVVEMTPNLTTEDFAALAKSGLCPTSHRQGNHGLHAGGRREGFPLDPEQTLYAVHSADGARLAVLADRASAIAAALAHELAPGLRPLTVKR